MKVRASLAAVLPCLVFLAITEAFEPAHHHDYKELMDTLRDVHERCPKITKLYNLTGSTTENRKLGVIVMSENPEEHKRGE